MPTSARKACLSTVVLMSDDDRRRCPHRVIERTLGKLIPMIDLFLTASGRDSRPGDFGPGTSIGFRTGRRRPGGAEEAVHIRVTCDRAIATALHPLFPNLN